MMSIYTVSFFGHRYIYDTFLVEKKLERVITKLLSKNNYVEFLVGRNGEFDQIVSSVIRRCKNEVRNDNSAHILILPYVTAEFKNNEVSFFNYYDEIDICPDSLEKHFKEAHQARNRYMVNKSDLVVFFVKDSKGGAYQTLRYTKKISKRYINLFEEYN